MRQIPATEGSPPGRRSGPGVAFHRGLLYPERHLAPVRGHLRKADVDHLHAAFQQAEDQGLLH